MDDQRTQAEPEEGFDTADFEEWLSEMAEAKDTSPQDILDQMISSYWFLDEVGDLLETSSLEESDIESLYEHRDRLAAEGASDHSEADAAPDDRVLDLIEILKDVKDGGRSEQVREVFDEGQSSPAAAEQAARARAEERRYETIRDIERLRQRLEDASARLDAVDTTASGNAGAIESLEEQVEALDRAFADRVGAVDAEALSEQVDELAGEVAEVKSELTRGLGGLEHRIGRDEERSAEIMEHILDQLDTLEPQITQLTAAVEDVQPVLDAHAARERLRELRRAANQAGADTATCEDCEREIDIGLLDHPECPHCGQRFSELRTESGWLWPTHYLGDGAFTPAS